MSWKATAFVKDLTTNLSCTEKLVLLVLADYHHTQKKAAWPSIPLLAKECLTTERNLYRILGRLEEKQFITRNVESGKLSEYRICGLDTPDILSGVPLTLPLTSEAPTPDNTPDITGIVIRKNGVERENRYRGTRLPVDFKITDDHRRIAEQENLPTPESEINKFRDYWSAIPGAKGFKLDWDATFRNWLRNSASKIRQPPKEVPLRVGIW
jgi:Helix-turn-helix domain